MYSNSVNAFALGLVASLASPASAFWRMPCPGRLVLERIDPIISPGQVSGHVHTVSGGSGLSYTTSYEQQRASACSSCPIKQDLSAYWTPKLYYMGEDGTSFEDVPQAGEGEGTTGGLTVYYEQRPGPNNDKLQAFPSEINGVQGSFRMVAGNPYQRNYTGIVGAPGDAVSFVCLNYNGPPNPQTNDMPNYNCPDGLRAQVYFPSCWDGKNFDSPDHSSHMAYPIGQPDNGVCPDSHPVHLISIFYEVIYQTNLFADRWHSKRHHPFVFAMGDRTGYGFHGDFVNGWDTTALQTAVDTCNNDSGEMSDCPVFDDLFSDEQCQACQLPPSPEKVTGNLTTLPGCNPVTNGPAFAPPPTCAVPAIGSPTEYFTDVTSLGYEYVGCGNDSTTTRTLQGSPAVSTSSSSMTVEMCVNYCKAAGQKLAGLEYASQCYCANEYYSAPGDVRAPQPGILGSCLSPCAGNGAQTCGGADALSIYQACDGGSCVNAQFDGGLNSTSKKTRRHLHKHRRAMLHERS